MKLEEEIKQPKFKSEAQKLAINIIYTANWMGTLHHNLFKQHKISNQQYNILRILRGQKGKPANLGLLQERMLDKNSNASRLIDKLILKKLVTRKANKVDKRIVDIEITQEGLDLLEIIQPEMDRLEGSMNSLSPSEMITLNDLLDKLRD